MANNLPTYIILTVLLMMFTCFPSHAQFACSSTVEISLINNNSECTQNRTIVCPNGTDLCSGVCTDINTESNCGGCADKPHRGDHVCKLEQKCCNGVCCMPGEICCHGECTDTYNDPNNCGGCGNVGSGKNICQPDEVCCGGVCTDILFDDNNCGDCGNVCSAGAHCIDGECLSSDDTGMGTEGSDEES